MTRNRGQQQQQTNKGGSNVEQPELKVITNAIKDIKTVGSNEHDVEIAGAIVDGAVKQAEIKLKEAELNAQTQVKVQELQLEEKRISAELQQLVEKLDREQQERVEKRKMEIKHRENMTGKIVDGVKSVLFLGCVTTYLSIIANKGGGMDY